jgi:hypothetical protein
MQISLRHDTFSQTQIKVVSTDVGLAHISRQTTTNIRGDLCAVIVALDMIRVNIME